MITHALFLFKKVTTMGKRTPKTIINCTHYFTFSLQTTTNSCYNKLEVFSNYSQTFNTLNKISFL